MPPQIKADINRSGWESTSMPSVCEACLPDNPYVQMLKEEHGGECKLCQRPFTLFRWKADRTARQKRTIICLTCARLKNCCQHCMLDLQYGLPITIRDAALKMIAPGPQSSINREYYAQEHEKEIEEGRGAIEAYDKSDEKAAELLKKLSRSEPYRRKQLRGDEDEEGPNMKALPAPDSLTGGTSVGPVRTRPIKDRGPVAAKGKARAAAHPPSEQDWIPPQDERIKSLLVTGVEDDLPQYKISDFFSKYGKLQSAVVSHRSHAGYINFSSRTDAEAAADALRGKCAIAGCPLRVTWAKPKVLDSMDQDSRKANAKAGREAVGKAPRAAAADPAQAALPAPETAADDFDAYSATAPPGQDEVNYASMRGD